MSRLDTLNGVAHDLGHHAQSSLSWLYPHLGHACRDVDILTVQVDLLCERPYPAGLPERQPLALALASLRQTLAAILEKNGFTFGDLKAARVEFTFPPGYGDFSVYSVRSILATPGRTFERVLPMIEASSGRR